MRNWMMMALDAKLRAQANDEGADDGGFGDAFNEGIGEGGDGEGQPSSAGNEPPADDPEGGEAGGEGDAGAAGSGGDGESGTGEGAGEGTGESEGGEQGTGEGAGEGTGKGEGEGGQPTGQGTTQQTPASGQQGQPAAVTGDNGVPPDQHAGQQQLDPATLEAIFKAMGNNQGQNRQDAQGQPQQQAAEPPKKEIPKDWTEYLTDEDKQALDKYGKDWSEVSEPERIRTQAMMRLQEDQILSRVEQALAPIAEHYQQSQVQSHFGRIREAHEDFDTLRESGSLNQWAQTLQNPMLRTQAQYVLQQGSTDEVIGLIDLYKQFTGQTQDSNTGSPTGAALEVPASSQAPANGGQPKVTQQQGQTKPPKPAVDPKAAAATAAVKSGSRGADPRGGDKNDFMAGFEETASEQH